MDTWTLLQSNLLSAPVLAFGLGLLAVAVRSDLKVPPDLYSAMTIYLLLAIGLKGGRSLAVTPLGELLLPLLAALTLGLLIPLWVYAVARKLGRLGVADAAALAATYGSVSAVTFIAAKTALDLAEIPYEGFLPALLAVLEVPAIVVALLIARAAMKGAEGEEATGGWAQTLHEVLAGRSIVLMVGGLGIGWLAGPERLESVDAFFTAPFYGVLTLFLLEMGMIAARRMKAALSAGWFLLGFGVLAPAINGALGVAIGLAAGLSAGGAVLLGTLASSGSYIAATAACRVALPSANPGLYLGAALGITFPFNLSVGIPLYLWMAQVLAPLIGAR